MVYWIDLGELNLFHALNFLETPMVLEKINVRYFYYQNLLEELQENPKPNISSAPIDLR